MLKSRYATRLTVAVMLLLPCWATEGPQGSVVIAPVSLEELRARWVGTLGGLDVYCLALDETDNRRLSVASTGKDGFEIVEYSVEELRVTEGRISFVARRLQDTGEILRVDGTADYWELRLVLPRSAQYRQRKLVLWRYDHLRRASDAIEHAEGLRMEGQ